MTNQLLVTIRRSQTEASIGTTGHSVTDCPFPAFPTGRTGHTDVSTAYFCRTLGIGLESNCSHTSGTRLTASRSTRY